MPKTSKKSKPLSLPKGPSWLLLEGLLTKSFAGQAFQNLLESLRTRKSDPTEPYLRLWREVMSCQAFVRHPQVGNALQDYFLETFLEDPNVLHRKAEIADFVSIDEELSRSYAQDLETFQQFLVVDWAALVKKTAQRQDLPVFGFNVGLTDPPDLSPWEEERRDVKLRILSGGQNSTALTEAVCHYFRRNGFGFFGRHRAFKWKLGDGVRPGRLEPVAYVDPIRLADLTGYDEARKAFLDNLEAFVAGQAANNVLLYGERGTGKSSTVKASLNEYADRGLRLVELSPLDALDVSSVLSVLRQRPERYLLFLDDLSFNDDDVRYRGLKALLEGSVEPLPENVILAATSNRRHLMPETFAEREGGVRLDGEVHQVDAVEEKLSLSDRFGLVVSFYSPDQETYLSIVRHLAERSGLTIPRRELEAGALRWALQNNGRSGRAAAQFVRHAAQREPSKR
jgi:hypothetical protein